jgi:hypothetical protein
LVCVARLRSSASTAGQFVVVKSWNARASSTGPPSSRTTASSRFGCRFACGTRSSSVSSSASRAMASANRSYVGDAK